MSKPKEPSDIFVNAVRGFGTSAEIECQLCGRLHFSYEEFLEDDDEERKKELLKRLEEKPDKYVYHDINISYGHINGETVVVGCPCNGMRKFEDWIWSHRSIISTYLNERLTHELEMAKENLKKNKINAD